MNKTLTYSEYLNYKILNFSSFEKRLIYDITISIFFSIILALFSKIKVVLGFTPVPLTLQTFAVLFLSMIFGRKVLYILILYLFEGIIGLPVFAKGTGILYILGPTGGYLLGFLIAGYICGSLAELGFDKSFVKTFFAMFIGLIIIYIFGMLWFLKFVNFDFYKAVNLSILPFIIPDLIKIFFATIFLPLGWKFIKIK